MPLPAVFCLFTWIGPARMIVLAAVVCLLSGCDVVQPEVQSSLGKSSGYTWCRIHIDTVSTPVEDSAAACPDGEYPVLRETIFLTRGGVGCSPWKWEQIASPIRRNFGCRPSVAGGLY